VGIGGAEPFGGRVLPLAGPFAGFLAAGAFLTIFLTAFFAGTDFLPRAAGAGFFFPDLAAGAFFAAFLAAGTLFLAFFTALELFFLVAIPLSSHDSTFCNYASLRDSNTGRRAATYPIHANSSG
jgi:hypothetical protein